MFFKISSLTSYYENKTDIHRSDIIKIHAEIRKNSFLMISLMK